ncbi:hypothetical protein F5884DRAFT_550393 [Xylogone sp. PMI_703]|nr:hypothetical protein F5884DRAFT_550393 [Xylogone sp. PMI_703]
MHNPDAGNANVTSPRLKLPDELRPYLILLSQPAILPVCLSCQIVVLPKSLLDHLRKNHELPSHLRKIVISFIATLPPLDFGDIPLNPDGSAPVCDLRVVDAFRCKQCGFIRKDVTDVRKHVNSEHKASAAGGYEKICAQSWFGGRRAIYWKVCGSRTKHGGHVRENEGTTDLKEAYENMFKEKLQGRCEEYYEERIPQVCDQEMATVSDTADTQSETSDGPPCLWGFFGASFWPKHPESTYESGH